MKSGKKKMHLKIAGAFLLLLMLCLSFCFTTNAAVSVNNIKKVSGGTFIQKNGKWMYRYQNGKTAKDCLLEIDGKTYYFSPIIFLLLFTYITLIFPVNNCCINPFLSSSSFNFLFSYSDI